jgi:predicted transcriptional regulator
MKYKITPIIVYLLVAFASNAQTKVVGECSVHFVIEQLQNQSWQTLGQKIVQVKGNQCKTTLVTPKLQQSIIFSSQEDSAIVLKEIGESKFFQKIV